MWFIRVALAYLTWEVSGPLGAVPASPEVWGSTTKMITAPAVLQLVEQGLVKLTDPINLHIDPILLQLNGTRLEDHFGSPIRDVEIQHLLHMTSGIQDYDGEAFSAAQFANRSKAFGPVEILSRFVSPTLQFSPGERQSYCSTNYILLGFVLATHHHRAGTAWSWQDYDQASVVPTALQKDFTQSLFVKHGPCSQYTPVHGFMGLSERTASEAGRLERQLLGRLDSGGLRWFRCRHCSFYIRPVQHQGPQDCHGAVASAFDKLHRSRNEWHAGSHHSCTACRRFKLSRSTSLFLSLSLSLPLSLSLSLC